MSSTCSIAPRKNTTGSADSRALSRELREVLQGLRIGGGADVGRLFQRRALEQLLDWHFHLLAAERARDGGHGDHLVGHVPRRKRGAERVLDPGLQGIVHSL